MRSATVATVAAPFALSAPAGAARGGDPIYKPGYGNSTFNVMSVRGKEVYRKNTGDAGPALTEI